MFKKHKEHKKRGSNPIVAFFRLILSLVIFAVLIGGIYSAYKQFSGMDPLKLNPNALISNFLSPEKTLNMILALGSADVKSKLEEALKPKKDLPTDNSELTLGEATEDLRTNQQPQPTNKKPSSNAPVRFRFTIVTDSHNDNELLLKALNQAKNSSHSQNRSASDSQFIIGLGDYTEVGTKADLESAKKQFDSTGVRYFLTAGDHDLWDSRDKGNPAHQNYNLNFGSAYQSFDFGGVKFLILDNSDNYQGLGDDQLNWLNLELEKIRMEKPSLVLAFLHEPLYHPSSDRVMGKVTPELKTQAKELTKKLKNAGVKEVFFGDIHYFTRYQEPETGLSMTTIGAVTSTRNAQLPRFAIVTVFEDNTVGVEDVEIR